jgi:hypothetical protein
MFALHKIPGIAALFLICTQACGATKSELTELIENVRANEELYRDIEIVHDKTLTLHRTFSKSPDYLKSSKGRARYVYQGENVFFQNDEQIESRGGNKSNWDTLQGYDGRTTRAVEQHVIANIHEGRFFDGRLFFPHTRLLLHARISTPLSEWLASDGWMDYRLAIRIVGTEPVRGLNCVKLRCETWNEGQEERDYRDLWLAIDRNYLPIRTVGFAVGYSRNIPLETGEVNELREVEPGIWFPFKVELYIYDEKFASQGKTVLANVEKYTVSKVNLNPQYDDSLFSDIPIPDGAQVFEMRDGEVLRSYIAGERTGSVPNWLIWLIATFNVLLLSWIGWRLWHRRRVTPAVRHAAR